MPFFCPILPNTPIDRDQRPGRARAPTTSHERVVNQRIVLKRNPFYRGDRPANVDQVVLTISRASEACVVAVEQDRIDYCFFGLPETRTEPWPRSTASTGPAGSSSSAPRSATWFVAFNHDRPAFRGPGQIPLEKAINYAIDRPEMARTFGYLGGKRTDQMLPPALARPASIYPLEGADPATARKWLARANAQAEPRSSSTRTTAPQGVAIAQTLVFNLKQIGIDVEVKYFDFNVLADKVGDPRGAVRPRPGAAGSPTTATRPASSSRLLYRGGERHRASTSTTHASTRESRRRTA